MGVAAVARKLSTGGSLSIVWFCVCIVVVVDGVLPFVGVTERRRPKRAVGLVRGFHSREWLTRAPFGRGSTTSVSGPVLRDQKYGTVCGKIRHPSHAPSDGIWDEAALCQHTSFLESARHSQYPKRVSFPLCKVVRFPSAGPMRPESTTNAPNPRNNNRLFLLIHYGMYCLFVILFSFLLFLCSQSSGVCTSPHPYSNAATEAALLAKSA